MTDKTFKVSVITPQRIVYEGHASSLIAPAESGYLGILADHAPLVANLVPGRITVRGPSDKIRIFNSAGKGIIEVLENNVSILADFIGSSI